MAASGPTRSRLVPGLLVRLVLGVDLDADAHELEQRRAESEPARLRPRHHEEDKREDRKDNDARDPQGQHDRTLQRPFALLPGWVSYITGCRSKRALDLLRAVGQARTGCWGQPMMTHRIDSLSRLVMRHA